VRITTRQAIAFRLARHHLDSRAPARNLVTVASDVCGIQAQLMSAAYIALWARIEHLSSEAIEDSIARKRTLVKTWAMRGTVHLLATTDLMVYLGDYCGAACGPMTSGWHVRVSSAARSRA